jgi:glutamate synthase domain-containing protein 2
MVEVKLSQGAKPGHGGILPKAKITPTIAEARGLKGADLLRDVNSPPRHAAFDSVEGLLEFVATLRELSGGLPVGFKLCVGRPIEVLALVDAMRRTDLAPDFITVDGGEGGTGAAPPEFSDSVGVPLDEALTLVNNMLLGAGMRDRVTVIASGKVHDSMSLVRTMALGADACNAARGMMFALGCIQALKCHTNTCPTGITTQKPELMEGLVVPDKAQRVANYHAQTLTTACEIAGAAGLASLGDIRPEHVMRRTSRQQVESFAGACPEPGGEPGEQRAR